METIFAQIAADAWKVRPEDVVVSLGDTAAITTAFGVMASRCTVTVSSAIQFASKTLREKAFAIAANLLAEWVACAPPGSTLTRFCLEAMGRLWFSGEGRPDLGGLWRAEMGDQARIDGAKAVRRNERRMRVRGIYDVPGAWVHGQWFFAHDRPAQIEQRLDDLGWTVA